MLKYGSYAQGCSTNVSTASRLLRGTTKHWHSESRAGDVILHPLLLRYLSTYEYSYLVGWYTVLQVAPHKPSLLGPLLALISIRL